jgi:hypothetical protein
LAIILTEHPAEPFNSYASIQYFKDRMDLKLRSYVGKTDDQIASALITATEYADIRWGFVGYMKEKGQSRQWPRLEAYDIRGDLIEGIPAALKNAVCEYAWRVLNGGELMPDPTLDERGQVIKSIAEKVGPIETDIVYDNTKGVRLPSYPNADNLLIAAGLVARKAGFTVGTLGRA